VGCGPNHSSWELPEGQGGAFTLPALRRQVRLGGRARRYAWRRKRERTGEAVRVRRRHELSEVHLSAEWLKFEGRLLLNGSRGPVPAT
jgi:hypothetical protein